MNLINHLAKPCGLLVPRIIAAFFKMSFSMRNWAFSLRVALPAVEKVGPDAELLAQFGNRFAGLEELHGLGLELIGVSSAGLGSHLELSLVWDGPKI
jgi:hypothetical protein